MTQTKKGSLHEALIGTGIGFAVSLVAGYLLYPIHGAHFSISTNLLLTAEFTVISVVRGYVVRRWFNKRITVRRQVHTKIATRDGVVEKSLSGNKNNEQ